MSDFADIFAQIIQKLGGRDAVQSLLGVGPSALSNYLRRAELPRDKMAIISTALHAEGWSFEPTFLQVAFSLRFQHVLHFDFDIGADDNLLRGIHCSSPR